MRTLGILAIAAQTIAYDLVPNSDGFGATITGISVEELMASNNLGVDFDRALVPPHIKDLAVKIKEDLHKHYYLNFPSQDGLPWQAQLAFLQLFGEAYDETAHVNRKTWTGEKDPRVGVFSNHPEHGLVGVGVEGFHSDGNVGCHSTRGHSAILRVCDRRRRHAARANPCRARPRARRGPGG